MNQFVRVYLLLLGGIFCWCGFIIAAPYLAHRDHELSSGMLYLLFSQICHQHASRSLFIWGKQLAVCSRCTGIYLGFLFGAMVYPIMRYFKAELPPRPLLFVLAAVPMTFDMSLTLIRFWENTSWSRFSSGFLFGNVISLFIIPGILIATRMKNNRSNEYS